MTLPTSRDATMVDGAEVPSALLNDLQDCIIAGKGGAQTLKLGPSSYLECVQVPTDWVPTATGRLFCTGVVGPNPLSVDLPLRFGDRITAVRIYFKHGATSATSNTKARLYKTNMQTDAETNKSDEVSSVSSAAAQQINLTGITPVTIEEDERYYVRITSDDAAAPLDRTHFGLEIDFDHP